MRVMLPRDGNVGSAGDAEGPPVPGLVRLAPVSNALPYECHGLYRYSGNGGTGTLGVKAKEKGTPSAFSSHCSLS